MVPVGIVGANGFLGGELVRLLAQHPHARVAALCAGRSAGQQLSDIRPSLRGPADGPLEAFDADLLASRCEAVFLALPHGKSAEAARELRARGVLVIDLGSDFRIADPAAHARWYGREPGAPELLDSAVYSLPELTGPPPADAGLIANPGCFATALALTLAPLAPALGEGTEVTVFGVTGSSGSGIEPQAGTQHTLRVNSFTAYKPLRHQHLGEVEQLLARRGAVPRVRFVPHSLPAPRGIHLTVVLDAATVGDVRARYEAAYGEAALVDVVDGVVPMGAVLLSCRTLLGVEPRGDDVVVTCALDNLLKGGSGQAIQNLNLVRGWSETAGLPVVGSWP
ncbi:MAG: N-acetyl-gamma-glutamyl-phosphate reductase [Alphaproteobacteria bacterium]|nr:N-acetyl-gamma-glutamyl-phosphate reductase [Alphaproteobacteria bacterium]